MNNKKARFASVGIFNTLLNVLMFNVFIFIFGLSLILSNFVAISISIFLSFLLNKRYVFGDTSTGEDKYKKLMLFVLVTVFSQFVIQQFFLVLFSEHLPFPGLLVFHLLGGLGDFSKDFWIYNTAKAIGIAFSLIVNFIIYDRKIFKTS